MIERKLSEKATKMRQRFSFSRSAQRRARAATVIASPGTATSSSRPRSATSPVSAHAVPAAWDNPDTSRQYDFTDEPGFFRPASPLIDRPDIGGALETDVKHACALLAHSIERGIPMTLSYQTTEQPAATHETPAAAGLLSAPVRESSLAEAANRGALSTQRASCKGKHDSGVAFGFHSPGKAACTGVARFYGKRLSTSAPQAESRDRGRSRGPSIGADASSRRSRSASPMLFPYSPPQIDARWRPERNSLGIGDENGVDSTNGRDEDGDVCLGAEGLTWLRASLDVERMGPVEQAGDASRPSEEHAARTAGPPPGRFYRARRRSSKASSSWKRVTSDGWASRDSSVYSDMSTWSLSSEQEKMRERNCHTSHSRQPTGLKNHEMIYPVVVPDARPRHRRKRASQLLKKLAGLGIRRREPGPFGGERMAEWAVEVVG